VPPLDPAVLSLAALLVVIGVSLTSRINVGVLSLALAWLVAVIYAGWKPDALMAVFPSTLFVTLVGVTLLFSAADKNRTLNALTDRAVGIFGHRPAVLPWLFFLVAAVVSSVGPGAVAATALVAPLAMATAATTGVSPFPTALMVGNGANAGNLSPFSSVGLIVQAQMLKAGVPGHEWSVFLANFVAHTLAAIVAYLLFYRRGAAARSRASEAHPKIDRLAGHQWTTIGILVVWIAGIVLFKMNPGLTALAAVTFLILVRAADDRESIKAIPWSIIVMVCGVSVLVGVLEKTGGLDLFSTLLSRLTAPRFANGAMAFVTGLISTYSSTSGAVYPAFLPTVPGLVAKLGGGDPLQIALSINVGAAIVDVSPLSTIGALCLAALPAGADAPAVFRRLLLWGFAMVIAGTLFCQLFIRFFAW
jgi:Na+/H+ antiporter NhaD/arsenite permease-like protein